MKKPLKLKIEDLEERIAPGVMSAANAAAGAHSPVFYQGDGLHTPGGHVVPQDLLAGPGFGAPGQADGDGSLIRVFGPTPF